MDETVRTVFEMACPACGRDDALMVVIATWAHLSLDGTDPAGDHEWDDRSGCRCEACDYIATVAEFHTNNEEAQNTENA